ncbi:MAG: response regulator, partial [Nitrospira sp.]|nr:response regulator [Nitrospira sp.]
KKFTENQDRIDLLLLDVIMPNKNGKEVFDAARKLKPDIKALFISAHTAEVIKKHKSPFADDRSSFMQKPFLPENLLTRVRTILDS